MLAERPTAALVVTGQSQANLEKKHVANARGTGFQRAIAGESSRWERSRRTATPGPHSLHLVRLVCDRLPPMPPLRRWHGHGSWFDDPRHLEALRLLGKDPRTDSFRRQPHTLTRDERRRGGLASVADYAPEELAQRMREVVADAGSARTVEQRRCLSYSLLAARRARIPMMGYPGPVPEPSRPCEVCRRPGAPYLVHPLRTCIAPTWRCLRHATARREEYECATYRRPTMGRSRGGLS